VTSARLLETINAKVSAFNTQRVSIENTAQKSARKNEPAKKYDKIVENMEIKMRQLTLKDNTLDHIRKLREETLT
jgi:hypothetical protein